MIEDPSRSHIVRLRQDSYIAQNPIVDLSHDYTRVSINFANYLSVDQYPQNTGCAKARSNKVHVNYMYGNDDQCAYGKLRKIPYVHYHEETNLLPYDYVFLKLNALPG